MLQTTVERDPRDLDQPTTVWTCGELASYLPMQGWPPVSAETVRRHVRRLDYRSIRPVPFVRRPDPEYATKAARLPVLHAQAERGEIVVSSEDDVDLTLLPGVIGCWTKRGSQRKIATPGQNIKRYGFGAINDHSGALVYWTRERKNSLGFAALLTVIAATYAPQAGETRPKGVLVLDNSSIHRSTHSRAVVDRDADWLEIVGLPTYAPQLNLIERVWKYLRRKVTHNHLYAVIDDLVTAVEAFIDHLTHHPHLVRSICGHPE